MVNIITERFLLRELKEKDITERYLEWLSDTDAKKFITAASETKDILDLRQYVLERTGVPNILFLGIFEKTNGLHIGNIKYEPVDINLGYAIMGILIGDATFRGKGVTPEVLKATAEWLKINRKINQIVLGVSKNNQGAIRAYEKVGFQRKITKFIKHCSDDSLTMVWDL